MPFEQSRPVYNRAKPRRINFHGGQAYAPTVGGFGSFISRQARKVKNVASTVADTGSSVIRTGVSTIGRPIGDVTSAIVHPVANALSDVPIIGSVAKLMPVALKQADTYVKVGSRLSGFSSNVASAIAGKGSSSVEGQSEALAPFAKGITFVGSTSEDGALSTWAFIGLAGGKNIFVPAVTMRPYMVRDSESTNGYKILYPTKATSDQNWKNSALMISNGDLQAGIGGTIQTDFGDGKIHTYTIYAHTKIAGDDPRTIDSALKFVPSSRVVISENSVYADPNYEDVLSDSATSTSTSTNTSTNNNVDTTVKQTSAVPTPNENGLSTTAKAGIGAAIGLAAILLLKKGKE